MSKQITQFYYTAEHKPNQLIYGSGQTAVITGWTVKETLRKHLKDNEYAVIGQLYSPTRGINLLIRNLLLNPHVRYLVILNATKEDKNAGACQCLGDFFRYGVEASISDTGRKSWVILSLIPGYIDIDIDINALEKLRRSVEIQDAISISDAVEKIQYYGNKEIVAPWVTPLQFAMNIVESNVFPGTLYGHRIEGKTIAETWVKIIHRIKTTGTIRPTGYDGKWQELIDLMAVVTEEPDDFYFPEPNYLPIDRSFLEEYISQILDDAINQEGVKYTYGQRLRSWFGRDQIEQVIEKLIGEIDAASAVMTLWYVKDHEKGGSPCLNHIWLRVVDNELSLTAVLRSNDMFAAWPANAMGLRSLQKHIRNEICQRSQYDLRLAPLITLSQSAHIYDDTWSNAEQLIKEQYSAICKKLDYYDPAGNFLIEIADDKIVVTHTTPGSGEIVGCYSEKNPLKMIKEICAALPAIRPDHAGYLGMELQKAANCLKIDKSYIQDR